MIMRVVIADDEDLARRGIRALLERASDVEVVAECRNGREAISAVRLHCPDLMFLDVQMPGSTGFDVIEAIGADNCPYIVFVTAFDDYAIRAFDVHALDFVLKPLNEERFDDALARARGALATARDGSLGRRFALLAADVKQLKSDHARGPGHDRIPVKSGGRVHIVRVADIDWVGADQDYVSLYVGTKAWLLRETIGAAEIRLAPAGFVRIHRSTLVNIDRVRELRPLSKGEFTVVLHNGTELKLSRNFRAALERLAGTDI